METDEVFVIRRLGGPVSGWCTECRESTRMARPDEAALIAGVSLREINRLIEVGYVHFVETPDGLLLVCINSLLGLDRRQQI